MRYFSRKHLIASALVLSASGAAVMGVLMTSAPAHAQWTVFDPSNYSQNILTAARSLQQINNQVRQLQNQAQSLINQAKNLTTISFPELTALQQTIQQIDQLMGQARGIQFRVATLDQQFRSTFPTSFNAALTNDQHVVDARARLDTSMAAYQQTMTVQVQVVENIAADEATLAGIVSRSQGAEGALQVSPAEASYHPTDPQIAWFLSRFVTLVRSVSLDPVLMRQEWLSAYDFTTRRGAVFLGDYARAADPFGHVGEKTVSVQVTSVVRASDRSFQVKWMETAYERGALTGISHWTAILTVKVRSPSTAEMLRRNPLGLYVDAIDWSRELEPAETAPNPPARPRPLPAPPPSTIPLGSPLDPNLAAPTINSELQP